MVQRETDGENHCALLDCGDTNNGGKQFAVCTKIPTADAQVNFWPDCYFAVMPGWLGFEYARNECGRWMNWQCIFTCTVWVVVLGTFQGLTLYNLRKMNKRFVGTCAYVERVLISSRVLPSTATGATANASRDGRSDILRLRLETTGHTVSSNVAIGDRLLGHSEEQWLEM